MPSRRWRDAVALLGLAGAAIGPLLPTLELGHHSEGYYFDLVARGLSWSEFAQAALPSRQDVFVRPLALWSWKIDAALGGGNPRAYHRTNLGLHLLNVGLLFLLVRASGGPWSYAAAAALLFAWFPAHATTVGWVVARFDLLATAGALISMLALALALRGPHAGIWSAMVPLGYLAALMCKESVVALPLALTALVWLRRPAEAAVGRAVALCWLLLGAYWLARWAYLLDPWGYADLPLTPRFWRLEWWREAVVPFLVELVPNLTLPCSALRAPAAALPIGYGLLLLPLAALGRRSLRPRSALLFGAVLLAAALAPVYRIALGAVRLHDWYYLYLPAAGVAVVLAVPLLADRSTVRRSGAAALVLLGSVYLFESRFQIERWLEARRRTDELLDVLATSAEQGGNRYVLGPQIALPWVVPVNLLASKLRDAPLLAARSFPGGLGLMNPSRIGWLHRLPPYKVFTSVGAPGVDGLPVDFELAGLRLGRRDAVLAWEPDSARLVDLTDRLGRALARPAAETIQRCGLNLRRGPAGAILRVRFAARDPVELGRLELDLALEGPARPVRLELLWRQSSGRWIRARTQVEAGAARRYRIHPQGCSALLRQRRPIDRLVLRFLEPRARGRIDRLELSRGPGLDSAGRPLALECGPT